MLQNGNGIGDLGTVLIGEGLKVNRSLESLNLVRLVFFVFARAMQGEDGQGVRMHSRVCCRGITKLGTSGLVL